jgi:hypothetical protein
MCVLVNHRVFLVANQVDLQPVNGLARGATYWRRGRPYTLQGYLNHKKTPTPLGP